MGRPDLTEERTAQILDAFERCVARYGLEGSSLERVAEEANVKRSILRHYVGNRDDLIIALAERVVAKYRQYTLGVLGSLSDRSRVRKLMEFFFPDQPIETADSVLVVEALISAADQYPRIQELMTEYIDELVKLTAEQLRQEFPAATRQQCWSVAYGVVCICFNQESLISLHLPKKFLEAARFSARRLIDSLGEHS